MAIRILHVIETMLGMGGMEKGVVNLIRHMDPGRFEHVVCVIRSLGELTDAIPEGRAKVLCLGHTAPGFAFLAPKLLHLIREFEPDIVHSRNRGAYEAVLAGYWAGSCAVVHSEHGVESIDSRPEPWRHRQLRRLIFGLAGEVCAVSYHLRDYHALRTGFPVGKIRVIHNGVDVQQFRADEAARRTARRRMGIADDEFCIGAIGRLEPIKDIATLIRAAAETPGNCRLLIAGDGGESAALRELAQSRLPDCVQFLGEIQEIPELLNALDVYALPSLYEGICNSLLEAMASRLPVVATATGGNPEVIVDGESGILFPVGDAGALARALDRLRYDPAFRARLGHAAQERVRSRFSLQSMVNSYDSLYTGLAAKPVRLKSPRKLIARDRVAVVADHSLRE